MATERKKKKKDKNVMLVVGTLKILSNQFFLLISMVDAKGNIFVCFCFGTVCGTIIFAMAPETTISCSLGRQYGAVLNPYFFDVYTTDVDIKNRLLIL
jgi:hypothetical protein